MASLCAFILPATVSAEQVKPPSGIEVNKVSNPLDQDEEYQSWIIAARAAAEAKDWHQAEEILPKIIEREEKLLGPTHHEIVGSYSFLAEALSGQGKYEEALTMYRRALELSRKSQGERHLDTVNLQFILANALHQLGRLDEALTMFQQVLELNREVRGNEHPDTLASMRTTAYTLSELGRFEESLAIFREELKLDRRILGEEAPQTLTAMSRTAIVLGSLRRENDAITLGKKVLELRRKVQGGEHPETLDEMFWLALQFQNFGRHADALALREQELALRRKIQGDEHPDTLTAMVMVARSLSDLGRFQEALALTRKELELRRRVQGNEHLDTLGSMNRVSNFLIILGLEDEALELRKRVLEITRMREGEEHPVTLTAMGQVAISLAQIYRQDEALKMRLRMLELQRKIFGENHPDTLNLMGLVLFDLSMLGRDEEAEGLATHLLKENPSVLGAEDPQTINIKLFFSFYLDKQGRWEEALAMRQQVLKLMRRVHSQEDPATLVAMTALASSLERLGRLEEAIAMEQQALELRRKVLGNEHPDTLRSMMFLADRQLKLAGHAHEALANASTAYKAYLGRREQLGSLGVEIKEQLVPERLLVKYHSSLLADALWAAARGKAPSSRMASKAFEALQISTAGTSSDAVARSAAMRHAAASGVEEEARRRRELASEWVKIEKQSMEALSSSTDRDAERRRNLAARLNEISDEIRGIDRLLEREAPRYFSIIRQMPLRISEARKLLREGEAVLIVSPTSFGTHVIVLTDKDLVWKRAVPDATKITALVKRLREDLDPAGNTTARGPDLSLPGAGSMPSFDRQSAYELYTALIEPVGDMLKGSSQVYIVADGALASLPFGVLVTSRPREGEDSSDPNVLRNTAWLADAWPIVQLPSLQSLAYLRTNNRPATKALASNSFAGFGDPLLGGSPFDRGSRAASLPVVDVNSLAGTGVGANGALLMDPERLRRLPRLPGTAKELEVVRLSLKAPESSLRLAEHMTESAIRTSNLTGVGILHLATHGLTAAQSGKLAEPGLVFTPPAVATPSDDGYLSSSEVVGLDLNNTDWVILSACNTAAASGKDGEVGLSGLARSFFYAGASTLLVSHWPVDDEVAAKITTSTINYSATGVLRAHALQTAMQDVRLSPNPRLAHPSAWAPFSILGDGR